MQKTLMFRGFTLQILYGIHFLKLTVRRILCLTLQKGLGVEFVRSQKVVVVDIIRNKHNKQTSDAFLLAEI